MIRKKQPQPNPTPPDSFPIKMRLSGTKEDLEKWAWFLELIESKDMITILDKSEKLYPNRGESVYYRAYFEIKLNR